ncbi:MAG: Fic family protein [Candidatus Omnitrophica bacterium]|jgi:Fic family protein|nr:Fic family protein [Candidatus Omnitrophota bacterium]
MEKYPAKRKIIAKDGPGKWRETESDRQRRAIPLELLDKKGKPFWFVLSSELVARISEIERNRGFLASLRLPKKFLDRLTEETERKEAYYSSRIEGAVTSLEVALLHLNRSSRKDYGDESLQMIVNNRDALEYMRAREGDLFSRKMICRLQEILVLNTHKEKPVTVGEYREGPVYVVDGQGKVVYEGPASSLVPRMMDHFIKWMNTGSDLHPLVKAALVHFYFVHIHPFDDGNGRSARALSNLYLMKQDYRFINFLSPSDYFDHHRGEYYRAIQNSESHDGDVTFFILYYLAALAEQLENVQKEIEKEAKAKDIRDILGKKAQAELDEKQIKALQWMLEGPGKMTTKKYCKLGRCSDETARKDFNKLLKLGLIQKIGEGRTTGYILRDTKGSEN